MNILLMHPESRRSAPWLRYAWAGALAVMVILSGAAARAQALTVLPVSIEMPAGQLTAVLTVIAEGDTETSFQVRPYAWAQPNETDQLSPTNELLVSPPLGTIPPGGRQVIRLVLRNAPTGQEAKYRILLDQIPPPATPGTVRLALRLSIPVFAEPATRVAPQLQWRIDSTGGRSSLVAVNSGRRHDTIRGIKLYTAEGAALDVEAQTSPYVLPGATRRWRILGMRPLTPGTTVRLVASGDGGVIDQAVRVDAAR